MNSVYRLALVDLDGTLWRDGEVIEGAVEFIERLRAMGTRPVFFTNNSSRTPPEVVQTLETCGIAADDEDVCTSAQSAAHEISAKIERGSAIAYIGRLGLREAIENAGYVPMRATQDALEQPWVEQVKAAVVGSDQEVTYRGLALISRVAHRIGWFVMTNPDVRLPVRDGFLPGNGAIGALIAAASGTSPIVTGKPDAAFVDFALERYGCPRDEAVIIGDNPYTDILAGIRAGVYTIRVETGVQYPDEDDMPVADLTVPSVKNLFLQ